MMKKLDMTAKTVPIPFNWLNISCKDTLLPACTSVECNIVIEVDVKRERIYKTLLRWYLFVIFLLYCALLLLSFICSLYVENVPIASLEEGVDFKVMTYKDINRNLSDCVRIQNIGECETNERKLSKYFEEQQQCQVSK